MSLINCELNLDLYWSKNIIKAITDLTNQVITVSVNDTKLYVRVVTLSFEENERLLEQLKSGFKKTIEWDKYQQKISTERQSQDLD